MVRIPTSSAYSMSTECRVQLVPIASQNTARKVIKLNDFFRVGNDVRYIISGQLLTQIPVAHGFAHP